MLNKYFLLLFLVTAGVNAQTPTLVKNINNTTTPNNAPFSTNLNLISGGSFLLFAATGGLDGEELWKSDLTAGGTQMIKNLYTGLNDSRTIYNLTTHNGYTYFTAGTQDFDLWRTDGTAAGTTLIKSFSGGSSVPYKMYSITTGLWIIFEKGNDIEIWKSDGSSAGTTMVKTIVDGANYVNANTFRSLKYNNKIYFAMGDNTAGIEPWISDGTVSGTFMLKNIASGNNSSLFWYGDGNNSSYPKYSKFIVYNSQVLFTCMIGTNVQIWKTNGTTAGTLQFFSPPSGLIIDDCSAQIAAAAGYVFFIGTHYTLFGTELCYTDGTAANTFFFDNTPGLSGMWAPFHDERIHGSNANYVIWDYADGNNLLSANATTTIDLGVPIPYEYFDVTIGNNLFMYSGQNSLLKTDGTLAGTLNINPGNQITGIGIPCVHNGELYFPATSNGGVNLWKSNGTTAGTVMQSAINSAIVTTNNNSYIENMMTVGNNVYFPATDGNQGTELWKTDGTNGGTVNVKDIYAGSSGSNPEQLFNWNGTLLFTADDGNNGRELWKSDGTANGTVMIKDIYSGNLSSTPSQFVNYNNTVYFSAYDAANGCELWKTDGNTAGTVLVKDFNPSGSGLSQGYTGILGIYSGSLLISAYDPTYGTELWKSDGTTGGTVLLKDIFTGVSGSRVSGAIEYNGLYYFVADNGSTGRELWVTDGSANGTQLVKDINSGTFDSDPYGFFLFGNKFYFTAFTNTNGRELWVSDGTSGGTQLIVDATTGTNSTGPSYITPNGSYFFFFAEYGEELWKSDGTTGGSSMIGTICSNGCNNYSYAAQPVLHNGQLYFHSDGDVFSSDGNSISQVGALNLAPGFKTYPTAMASTNLGLLVALDNQTDGNECWLYNGTTATLLGNINTAAMGSYVQRFYPYNNMALMNAYSINTNYELYKIDNITVLSGLEDVLSTKETATSLLIYPVPSADYISLQIKDEGRMIRQVEIFDLEGRLQQTQSMVAVKTSTVDLSTLSNGYYIVRVTDQRGNSYTAKAIKANR